MVERGHLSGIDRAVGKEAIPALPDGGRPHRHRIEPRRAFTLREQVVSDVNLPNTAQSITYQRRPHEAGADVVSTFAYKCHEPFGRMPALLGIFEQTKLQRQRVGSLGVTKYAPGERDVLGVEGLANLVGQPEVMRFLLGSAKYTRDLPEQFG